MAKLFLLHRYRVGNRRVIGLEIPEPAARHAPDSVFVNHWQSTFSKALAAAHSRARTGRKLKLSVARELESVYAQNAGPDFLSGIVHSLPTRRGNVFLAYRLPARLEEIPLEALRQILAENPNLFGHNVVLKRHRRGKKP